MKRGVQGVTLFELLIAVTLLSLLSGGMLIALRIGLNAMDRADAKLMANRRSLSTGQILRSQIEGFMPVTVACVPGVNGVANTVAYFEGLPQSLRLVSSYSLEEAARGMPRVLEYLVIPGQEGKGVRLIVNESLYTGPNTTRAACLSLVQMPGGRGMAPVFPPIVAAAGSFVLADKLAFCRFSYRHRLPPPQLEEWLPAWSYPMERPTAIRVELAPLETDPSRVPLVTATVPIHVTRIPNVRYP